MNIFNLFKKKKKDLNEEILSSPPKDTQLVKAGLLWKDKESDNLRGYLDGIRLEIFKINKRSDSNIGPDYIVYIRGKI